MKKMFLISLVLALLVIVAPSLAQDELSAGVPVSGELTAEVAEIAFTYSGSEGEVIVMELYPVDILADYDQPSIILQDSSGNELMRRDGYGETEAVWQLPADDTYTIIASRADDTSVGEFTLTVKKPTPLAINEGVSGTLNSEEPPVYFLYDGVDNFALSVVINGDYSPQVTIATINTEYVPGTLDEVGYLGGATLTKGSIGTFEGGQIYVIVLDRALLSFYFNEVTSDFDLSLVPPSGG